MTFRDWPLIRFFFSGFKVPGPLIAKVSRLWKLYHLLRGDYRAAVGRLHDRHGPLVQVAPGEFSISDKSLVYIPNLQQTSDIVLPSCQYTLERALRMANLYSVERQIDSCNESLFTVMKIASGKGENIDMSELLTRYAHEVMLCCTTGQRAGFLDYDTNKLDKSVLKNWKFYAILHGSYLRYHPFIGSMLKRWRLSGGSSADLMTKLMPSKLNKVLGPTVSSQSSGAMCSTDELETCLALTMAAADPTIALIMTALHYIYSTPELLEELRAEIAAAQLPQRPTFKQLILARPSMSKLHAVLLECTRLHPPYVTGPQYRSANGEVDGEQKIPPGSTIAIEPTIVHLNPGRFGDDSNKFNPMRWLDASLGPELQRTLLAFNIGEINNIETSQLLMASKLLVQFLIQWSLTRLPNDCSNHNHFSSYKFYIVQGAAACTLGVLKELEEFETERREEVKETRRRSLDDSTKTNGEDLKTTAAVTTEPNSTAPSAGSTNNVIKAEISTRDTPTDPEVSSGVSATTTTISRRGSGSSKASTSSADDRTVFNLPAANQLVSILGEDDANELMNGRFAPSLKNFIGAKALYTKPIPDAYHRRLVHKALDETHGRRISHFNDPDTNIMAIGLYNSIPRGYGRSKQQAGQRPNNNRPQQHNRNATNNRGGRGNQPSNYRGGNPPPRATTTTTTTSRPPPSGGFEAKWNNYATAEGDRADHWKTAEGYAERQAKMAAQDAAMKAAGDDAQPRYKTTFRKTDIETVDGKLGGVRKTINIEKY